MCFMAGYMLSTDTERWVSSGQDSQTPQRSPAQPRFLTGQFFHSNLGIRLPHPKHRFEGWEGRIPLFPAFPNGSQDAQWFQWGMCTEHSCKECLGAAHFPLEDTAASLQGCRQPAQQHALSRFPVPKPVSHTELSGRGYTGTRALNPTNPALLPIHTAGILLSASDVGPH